MIADVLSEKVLGRPVGDPSISSLDDFSSGTVNTGLLGADRDGIKNGALSGAFGASEGLFLILIIDNDDNCCQWLLESFDNVASLAC